MFDGDPNSSLLPNEMHFRGKILTASYSILSLFIIWGAVIVTCKCMGKYRVGLCEGRVHVKLDRSGSGSCHLSSSIWKHRCAFIIVGCCMILLCTALAGPGLTSIMTTSTSVRNSNIHVQDLIAEGLVILDTVDSVKRNIEPIDVSSLMNIEAVCPSFRTNLFMPVDSLRSTITAADGKFRELKQLLQLSDFEAIRQIVDTIWNATENIDSAVTTVEEHDWIVKMIVLFLGGLSFFMILRTTITLSSRRKCHPLSALTEIVILPLFVEALMIIWVATSAIAIASIPTAGKSKQHEQ